jgi:hypothetical protein
VDDFHAIDKCFEPEQPGLAPAALQRAIAQFGRGLKRDEGRASGDDRRVAFAKRAPGSRSALKTSVSITIGPRGRVLLTT